ncbi:MAG: hypothetical protein JRN29_04330, partial [Nitrososphaerota archaeon]|nr:hypothetical protein [Nitrososphaerota archaeon]
MRYTTIAIAAFAVLVAVFGLLAVSYDLQARYHVAEGYLLPVALSTIGLVASASADGVTHGLDGGRA